MLIAGLLTQYIWPANGLLGPWSGIELGNTKFAGLTSETKIGRSPWKKKKKTKLTLTPNGCALSWRCMMGMGRGDKVGEDLDGRNKEYGNILCRGN
jgi:hypothetical protein